MANDKDTSQRKAKQEKPVIRRDKVVVTKVTEQELAQIKSSAGQCGMTRSDFIRARALGYKPRQRLSETELDGLRLLAACRTDMVNFANALHGLTDCTIWRRSGERKSGSIFRSSCRISNYLILRKKYMR